MVRGWRGDGEGMLNPWMQRASLTRGRLLHVRSSCLWLCATCLKHLVSFQIEKCSGWLFKDFLTSFHSYK